MSNSSFRNRQIHLDYHTSPWIPDTGVDFDAEAFADQLEAAHVNSITVFAKCHHGQCYYPTETGIQHPALEGRDLLGEQLEALRKRGIRCPIYTTVVWEEDVAQRFPEWRQLLQNGSFAEWREATDRLTVQPGYWKFNDFMNPDYQDYFEAHLRELLDRYGEVDGFFVDILFFHQNGTWSESCRKLREELNIWTDDHEAYYRIEWEAQRRFMEKFNGIVHGIQPKAELFYNQQNFSFIDSTVGFGTLSKLQSQLEVESLPSGFWGYHHFPRLARQVFTMGRPWLAMTGRFQRQWGDFGGIKPVPALEYECFRSQAMGGGCSVGDQLHPCGVLDPAAYRLIGEVYRQVEEAEPFYEGTEAKPEIAILHPGHPSVAHEDSDLTLEGTILMCEESHYDCTVLNDEVTDLSPYKVVILPDTVRVTEKLKPVLNAYLKSGGKLLCSYNSGHDEVGNFLFSDSGLELTGKVADYPTYWRSQPDFNEELSDTERVIYQQGREISADKGWSVLVDRVLPYFRRSDHRFCSHFQTPADRSKPAQAAVVSNGQVVYFADPVFCEYRRYGSVFLRKVFESAMETLCGAPTIGAGLPVSMAVYPRYKDNSAVLTLLHYIPVRKALEIDVIEERHAMGGLTLKLDRPAASVTDWQTGKALESNSPNEWILPDAKGRLLLSISFTD